MKPVANPALEPSALYAKSQVYVRRGLRAQEDGDVEEYQLWASLALELLGKAALARVHPALVADPQHYQSLFAACGRQISPEIRTITAKTLFERLSHIEKAFDARYQRFCEQMALRRNSELHSGESPFSGMSAETWEREFWGAVETMLKMQGESLESWLGAEESKAPVKILDQAKEALEWAVRNRIARFKEDFEKNNPDPAKRSQRIKDTEQFRYWEWPQHKDLVGDGLDKHKCPACGAFGMLGGSLWNEEVSEDQDPSDPTTEYVDLTYVVEEFVCPTCGLRLFGTKETQAGGLPEEFTKSEAREREFSEEYMNE
jgi:hypothetical protein